MIRDDLRLDPPVHIPYGVEVFDKLSISPFEFFLAGSRYMGCARPDSDWDFITQDSPFVKQHLERMGFEEMERGYDGERGNTVLVMQKKDGDYTVQVQLCRSAHWKRVVRDIIKAHMLVEHIKMGKHQRNAVWDMLYATLSATAESYDAVPF
jgi:hypothetical protein